jgi:hypothetical protein
VVLTIGCRKASTKADILLVGQLLADTIGRPGEGVFPLCILGR